MSMSIDFFEIHKEIQKERIRQESYERCDIEKQADKNWRLFNNWARVFSNNDLTLKSFKSYLKNDIFGKALKGYIIKRIYEKYYGFSFEWNVEKNKWEEKKI